MYHMLTCFNLPPGTTVDEFRQTVDEFTAHMRGIDLVVSAGPIMRRHRHEIMDTDGERDHEFSFVTTFMDRAQCDRAVDYIRPKEESGHSGHTAVYTGVADPVFTCWEDI